MHLNIGSRNKKQTTFSGKKIISKIKVKNLKMPVKMGPFNDMRKNWGRVLCFDPTRDLSLMKNECFFFRLSHLDFWASSGQEGYILTLKAPSTTAADDKF